MPISPWYVDMTGQCFTIFCRDDSGQPLPLYNSDGTAMTPSQFTLLIKPTSGSEAPGGGIFQVVDPDVGILRYQPAASDVQYARTVQIAVQITVTTGPIFSDEDSWVIQGR